MAKVAKIAKGQKPGKIGAGAKVSKKAGTKSKTSSKTSSGVAKSDEGIKDKLKKVALQLFAKQGYDGTSTKQICDAAGANSAAVAYHFETKENLLISILSDRFLTDVQTFAMVLRAPANFVEFKLRLQMFCETLIERRHENADFHKVLMTEAGHYPNVRAMMREAVQQLHRPLLDFVKAGKKAGIISATVDAEMVALLVFTSCVGSTIEIAREVNPSLDTTDPKKRVAYIEKFFTILENGILKPENEK